MSPGFSSKIMLLLSCFLIFNRQLKKHVQVFFFCVGVMYSGEYDACDVTLSVSTPGKLEKYAWTRWESNLRPLQY